MNSVCILQRLVPRRYRDLPLILAILVLSLGCADSGERTQVPASKKVENQSPDFSEKNAKLRTPSILSPVAEDPAAPTTQKIDKRRTTVKQDAIGKQDPSEKANSLKAKTPDITSQADKTQSATTQQPATSPSSVPSDPGSEENLAAGLGKTATSNLDGESKQNTDPDFSQDDELADSDQEAEIARPQFEVADEQTIEIPETWKRLGKNEIWIDIKNKQVILAGYVCINVGALEMFACPAGTKEHESVVAVNALASEMHAALLAVGAQPGAPCSWDDVSFTTASGSKINIDVRWRDEKTNEIITRPAKEMMKVEGEEKLDIEWVFGGSRFHEDVDAKFRSYSANSGEMICVSNFSTAAIDVNIDSTDANGSWLFWANTENVPPRGTRVYLILSPGNYFKAQRHVFAEPEPAPIANKEKNQEPTAVEANLQAHQPADVKPSDVKPSDVKPADVKPADVQPSETKQPLTPPSGKKASSDNG